MFYRIQWGTFTLEEMQNHVSEDGGDDGGSEGVCACESVEELMRNTVWTTNPKYTKGAEVVVFHGEKITEIYDGARVYPTEIIERLTVEQFVEKYGG